MNERLALDSNAVRAVLAFEPAVLRAVGETDLVMPCMVVAENVAGWHSLVERYKRQQDEPRLADALGRLCDFHEFVRDMQLLRYTPSAQAVYASLRKGRGNRGRDDLRIAAICIAHDVPLLTRNVRDFDDLPDLKLRTW